MSSPDNTERYDGTDPSAGDVTTFPATVIHNPDTCTMFQVLAHRIQKWKMFGRYLGLSDRELDEIERCNHFTTERCLKMLVHWGKKYRGKYSELEAGIHNIMREDLIEDMRPFLPMDMRAEQCSDLEQCGHVLKIAGFSVQDATRDFQKLTNSVTHFVRKNDGKGNVIFLRFSHEKLVSPIELYLPLPLSSTRDCDLTVLRELCFASQHRGAATVDLLFEIRTHTH
jgi:hypothetical protein